MNSNYQTFTELTGAMVTVNVQLIRYVKPLSDRRGSSIHFDSNDVLVVTADFNKVQEWLFLHKLYASNDHHNVA